MMNEEQIAFYRKAATEGTIPDAENPLYLLAGVPVKLLARIVRGDFDLRWLAAYQLADQGLSPEGKWVGFEQAERVRRQLFGPVSKKQRRKKL